ncbi:hypothetical protein BsWGS_13880 [Bradybaena similaris]
MAAFVRSLALQGQRLRVLSRATSLRPLMVPLLPHRVSISTSKKNKDVGAAVEPMEKSAELKRLTEHFGDTDKSKEENWTSYGYAPGDRDTDWFYHHATMFLVVTIAFCGTCFIAAYMPDYMFRDWAQREAFLELERRERLGLPLVDPEYAKIDPSELPSDEEIGDVEIII